MMSKAAHVVLAHRFDLWRSGALNEKTPSLHYRAMMQKTKKTHEKAHNQSN